MSERAKHTPGPWHVYMGGNFTKVVTADYEQKSAERHGYSGGDITIANIEGGWGLAYQERSLEETHANARLIAAAPELLEALKRLLIELGPCTCHDSYKSRGLACTFDAGHGKGSHGRLRLGDRSTTLKDLRKEIGTGLLNEMCRQLGIKADDLK